MHQALLIPEVFLEIFAHVNQIQNPSSTREKALARKSIAALTTTCKTFHEPAMDLLWSKVDHGARWDNTWSKGLEPLSAHEARQFLRHAARVRSLNIQSDHFFHLLSVIPIEKCVFSRLRSLTWKLSTCKYMDLFLSCTLHRCSLFTINHDLKNIVTRCAALEDLSIKKLNFDASTADELFLLSDSVRLCKQLVTLSCPPLDWAVWEHLSNLPNLVRVGVRDVQIRGAPPWSLERDIANPTQFLNVTALSLQVHSAEYIITVMQHSQFPSLTELKLETDLLSSEEAEQFFCALSNCKACQTLQQLEITIISFGPRSGHQGSSLTAIPHLLCFTQLQTLRLVCRFSYIYLDNDLLLEAMSSWPHLRALEIEGSCLHPSTVTFLGLFIALQLCPHLHTLRVLIDPANTEIGPNKIRHTSLKTVDFDTLSPTANTADVARIIFNALPCVDQVNRFTMHTKEWDEVNRHLKSLKAAALYVAEPVSSL
ncbi:hypothetical protein EV702DRAFT_1196435 [Suillus placidus]|uniref:F-box domain-containing protein n=1 Tax=Suillus placidus TaxID=48579 RepID=A0A9P6ZXM1_9AGAM|nr:hypothetical protein EV702DRAFT_1196435 [Suillus placidus]